MEKLDQFHSVFNFVLILVMYCIDVHISTLLGFWF